MVIRAGGEATAAGFDELRPAHARHGGVNDFRPGIPGIRGGSPPSTNGPGTIDQTPAAAARVAWFGGRVRRRRGHCCTPVARGRALVRTGFAHLSKAGTNRTQNRDKTYMLSPETKARAIKRAVRPCPSARRIEEED